MLCPDRPVHAAPGTHVDVRLDLDGHVRTRVLLGRRSEDDGRRLTLGVQLARDLTRRVPPHARASRAGDVIEMTGPLQNFPLGVGADRYVLVAGGIGITALVAMADDPAPPRRRLHARPTPAAGVPSWPSSTSSSRCTAIACGCTSTTRSTASTSSALVGEIAGSPAAARTEMYMCGPIRLMDAVRRDWVDHELPEPNLRFETFGNSGAWAAEDFVVHIPPLDRSVRVGTGQSMLDALEDAGVDVMWDCRKGECGLCQVEVLDVERPDRPPRRVPQPAAEGRRTPPCASASPAPPAANPAITGQPPPNRPP